MVSWEWNGADGESYTVVVQTENGNKHVVTDAALTGGAQSITVTADGSVSPAPTIDNVSATASSTDDSVTFTWDAADTSDVSSYIICWAASQNVVQGGDLSSLVGNSCAETSDSTTSLEITEDTMCSAACSSSLYFAVGAKDTIGNVYSADSGIDHMTSKSFTDGVADPGVLPGESDPGAEDSGIGNAIYAIIGLVVLAVIGGAFILTRGAEADGDDKEWDY
jgi:hypothetical protein